MSFARNNQEVTPQGYDIEELKIISSSGEVDVTYLLMELSIIESLFDTNCITGSMILGDSLNIISNMPIMEGDRIRGHFTRNKLDPYVDRWDPDWELRFEFEIIKIKAQEKQKQDFQNWEVTFVSATWSDNLVSRVSKSYRQQPYSDMAVDIFNKWLKKGGLSGALPNKGIQATTSAKLWNIIFPNWKAYECISFLKQRAFMDGFVSYLFFEDKETFYFKTMQELMAAGSKAKYYTSTAETAIGPDESREFDPAVLEGQYNRIINIKMKNYHDVSLGGMAGMFSSRLIKHDIFNKMITDYHPYGPEGKNYKIDEPYDYFEEYGKLDHCDSGGKELVRDVTNTKFVHSGGDGIINVYPDHKLQWDDQKSFEPEKWVRQRSGHIESYKFLRFEVLTPGNFTRRVGDKIEIDMISPQWKYKGGNEEPELDSKYKGNYIIATLKRKFTSDSYVNVMEIIKDDYRELIHDPIWEKAKPPMKYGGHGELVGM